MATPLSKTKGSDAQNKSSFLNKKQSNVHLPKYKYNMQPLFTKKEWRDSTPVPGSAKRTSSDTMNLTVDKNGEPVEKKKRTRQQVSKKASADIFYSSLTRGQTGISLNAITAAYTNMTATPQSMKRKMTIKTLSSKFQPEKMKREGSLPRTFTELHKETKKIQEVLQERVTKTDLSRTQKLYFVS